MPEKYVLTLTREQAVLVKEACGLYAKLKIGQFSQIPEKLLHAKNGEDYCNRRDMAEELLLSVATFIFGRDENGLLQVEKDRRYQMLWNAHMALHDCLISTEPLEDGASDDGGGLPVCRIVKESENERI